MAILSVWGEWFGSANFDHDNITAEFARARTEIEKLSAIADGLNRELEQLSFRAEFHLAIALDPERRQGMLASALGGVTAEGWRRLEAIKVVAGTLASSAKAARSDLGKGRVGKPRKVAGALFVQESSEVFEYLTGTRAEREVSRDTGSECGPFYEFTKLLWVAQRGAAHGLGNSLKQWAAFRRSGRSTSRVIVSLASLYPEFGLVVEAADSLPQNDLAKALLGLTRAPGDAEASDS